MKHVISQRLERKNGFKRILDIFITRELARRSSKFNDSREIIEYKKLPRSNYDMIYAIHSSVKIP
jgi:hypothetical protein